MLSADAPWMYTGLSLMLYEATKHGRRLELEKYSQLVVPIVSILGNDELFEEQLAQFDLARRREGHHAEPGGILDAPRQVQVEHRLTKRV